ncbi:MAG TPA: ABC transporter ATP-binding protein [Acidimicrobiales bacterium]|nr:ABC transporter ATP-binding protein [Acidimicrobiales bacterium]
MSAVELRGVAKSYGTTPVLDEVDLVVPEGSITAVLGASGSGKTTLLRIVAGLERVDAGFVLIGSRVVDDGEQWVRAQHRRVGYVPQEGALFPHLTVERNVAFGVRRGGGDEVAELLDLVGLGGLGRRYPHQLSGGQQQRVALARALAIRPAVVLLDEPFGSLDAALRAGVRHDVAAVLRSTGTTALLVTHDQDEALSLADQVAVLRGGRVIAAAEPHALYREPEGLAAALSVGQANVLAAVVEGDGARTCLGTVAVAGPGGAGPARVLLRPEQLVLHRRAHPGATAATVRATQFHGHDSLVELVLSPPQDQELLARVLGDTDSPAPGSTVWIEVRGPGRVWAAPGADTEGLPPPGPRSRGDHAGAAARSGPRRKAGGGETGAGGEATGGTASGAPPRRNWRRVGILLACLAVVVGVGVTLLLQGGPGAASAVGPVVFHGDVETTGRVRLSDPFTDRATAKGVRSCARAAATGDQPSMGPRTWSVPTPPITNTVEIEVGTVADGYHGPGRYPRSAFVEGYGVMGIGQEDYNLASSWATMSMTVRPDGSGVVRFVHAPGDDDVPAPGWHGGISGTITWTCTS